MNIVDYKQYTKERLEFINNQESEWEIYTSPQVNNIWHKEIVFDNGAVWYERYEKKRVPVEAEARGVKVTVEIPMLEIEFWNSKNSESKYYYEKW